MDLLRAKLWRKKEKQKQNHCRLQISNRQRNKIRKIRTYNFPQDRVTDHRLGKSWGKLETIIDGDLERVIELTKDIH